MRVALRIEVGTVRGLREGVPNLMRLFSEFQVRASFFFPLGRDLSGRRPFHTWRDRSALGLPALAYGTFLPGPDLAPESLRLLRLARDNGHDVGLFGMSPVRWATRLAHAEAPWVERQYARMIETYASVGDGRAIGLATPDWQVHPALLAALESSRFSYTSFGRGKYPYLPQLQGQRSAVPEIPTTLPSVDEMLRQPGVSPDNVHEYLYAESRTVLPAGHVFSASAEHEGLARLPLMEKLLVMWKGQEGALRALGDMLSEIDTATLPHHQVGWGTVVGRDGHVAMQSVQVPT